MTGTGDRRSLETMLAALEPYLAAEARKDAQALRALLALFPGLSIAEAEKTVRTLLASSRKSVPALAERGRALLATPDAATAEAWLKDVSGLAAADLKQLGKALEIELTGSKTKHLEELRLWAESGGKVRPVSAAERMRQEAARHAGDLPSRMGVIDGPLADEIIRRAEAASKELNKEGFEAFATLLGIPVNGTKPNMLKQVKQFVNARAVNYSQTKF